MRTFSECSARLGGLAVLLAVLFGSELAASDALAPGRGGAASPIAGGPSADPGGLFRLAPLRFNLLELARGQIEAVDDLGGSHSGPGTARVFGGPGPADLFRLDLVFGVLVPNDNSGLAFGKATAREDFDVGGLFGVRSSVRLSPYFWAGFQIDFGSHEVDTGDVLLRGDLGRVYFLVPLTLEIPLGSPQYGAHLGFTIAPGLQLAIPNVDRDLEDFLAFNGQFVDSDPFAGLNIRTAVSLRAPIGEFMYFFIEGSYDWSWARAEVEILDVRGATLERAADEIDLSAFNLLVGLTFRM